MPVAVPRMKARSRASRAASLPDDQLVGACLKGDEPAWGEIVDRYGRLVYSIPRRYGFSDADADDVFQTVFVILYEKLGQVRDVQRLSAWLIRTTHRECYRIGKRSKRYAGIDQVIEDVGSPAEEDALAWERRHVVRQALRRLGGRCEELLTALFFEAGEPSYEVIAEQLDMKVGSIGPTRARCFHKLEQILIELGLVHSDVSPAPEGPSSKQEHRGSP